MKARGAVPLSAFSALVTLALFIHRAWHGLWFFAFSDETTHLLGGRVINSGGVLYRDFVDNHGPVIYMLSAWYGALVGWDDPNYARLISVFLVAGAGASIAASPALCNLSDRLCACALFFGLTASVWLLQGLNLVSFYPVAGALAVVVITNFWLPTCLGMRISTAAGFLSGVAAAFLGFTAYSYMPTAALFAVSGIWPGWRRGDLRASVLFVLGGLFGTALMLAWLARYADFVGYLAFHIAFNQTAFMPFTSFGLRTFLTSLNPAFEPKFLVQSWTLFAFAVGGVLTLFCAWAREKRAIWVWGLTALLGLVAVVMLDARGAWGLVNGPFLLGTIGLSSVILPVTRATTVPFRTSFQVGLPVAVLLAVGLTEALLSHATTTPYALDQTKRDAVPITPIARRSEDPLSERIRSIVPPGQSFLVLVYDPALYWAADRLPVPGFFAYFPWDAAYARSPWFNRPRDLCDALKKAPPRLIAFDIQAAHGLFASLAYMSCVFQTLDTRYRPVPGFPTLFVYLDKSTP